MSLFTFVILLVSFVAIWVTLIRPWLRKQAWADTFFATIEPVERWLWNKSETILWARLNMLLGAVLTTLVQLGSINLEPLKPILPEKYQWIVDFIPMILSLYGVVEETLRRDTTKPLALVAVSDNASAAVKAAVVKADITNTIAVDQVKQAA